jgi:GNAT superfamily N-acetyltransferase
MSENRTAPKRIRITGLQEAQVAALAALEVAATAIYYERGFDAAEVPTRSAADVTALTRHHNVRVAEADHEVAGYAAWRDESPGIAYIEEVSVHPDYQRFGVGTKLIEAILDEAREHNLKYVALRCWTRATWAMAFYRVLGFVPLDDAAPSKVVAWKDERSESGRPFTRPGEIAMWAPVSERPAEPEETEDEPSEEPS